MTVCEQEELIMTNMPLVKHIASKYHTNKIGMDYEDIVSCGVMGLLDASNKFDESRGVKFSTYAYIRISSYIIDEIRKHSPVSRTYISKMKEYNKCVDILQNKYLRQPTIEEISNFMNLSNEEVSDIQVKQLNLNTTSLDQTLFEDDSEVTLMDTIKEEEALSPSELVEKDELQEIMSKAIDTLKEKDRLVLSLYYYEELTLKEIGVILGVSESRVSQLNSRAISNLRDAMKKLKYTY